MICLKAETGPAMPRIDETVLAIHPAGPEHRVVTVKGPAGRYCRRPCAECPWRVDATVGEFPPQAFRRSAITAYDLAQYVFGCHMGGTAVPVTCAGFLLRGATHNLAVRLAVLSGRLRYDDLDDGGHALHASYRAMAIANGVAPDDPALAPCRD